jgi:hypothetical protein
MINAGRCVRNVAEAAVASVYSSGRRDADRPRLETVDSDAVQGD